MSEYHKIQTVYLRDPATKHKTLLEGQWALPEFGYLAENEWEWTEKVDGTNIRLIVEGGATRFGGRTDNAQIPAKLVDRLRARFETNAFLSSLKDAVLYGEGYGAGIQNGASYRADQDFILFDAKIGNYWLRRADIEGVAAALDVPCVPIVGRGTLPAAVEFARAGYPSRIGNCMAEGLVMRPSVELLTRGGERIITKIKHKDFNNG